LLLLLFCFSMVDCDTLSDEVAWPAFSQPQTDWMAAHNITRYQIHGYFNNRTITLIKNAGTNVV
jgi:hypothetical protein